jgi:tetratricopeptide (TPR) repeat protein
VALDGYHLAFAVGIALFGLACLGGIRQLVVQRGLLTLHYDPLAQARDFYGSSQLAKAVGQHRMTTLIEPGSEGNWFALGYVLAKAGDLKGAADAYRHVLRLNRGRADAHQALGEIALDENRLPEAIGELSAAVALEPSLARAHNGLGYAYAATSRLDEAIQHFQTALDLTGDPLVRANLERARAERKARDAGAATRGETP